VARLPADQNPRHYRDPIIRGFRFLAQDVLLKSFVWSICRVHVHGVELLDNVEEPFLAIANHSSHLDAPLVVGSLPYRLSRHLATGAAADYFFDKKLKAATTALFFNAYPVERSGTRTHKGLTGRLLDAKVPLLIFPEGTRSRTGAMGPFKPGVAALAIDKAVPVIPIALVGAFAAWPNSRPMPPTNHPSVHVVIGHPLTALPQETPAKFSDRLHNVVTEMYNATARAYDMPTLADWARTAALKQAQAEADLASQADVPPETTTEKEG